jgi:hypothetical protein
VIVVADGRVVAVDPIVQGRFWALVPGTATSRLVVYAVP